MRTFENNVDVLNQLSVDLSLHYEKWIESLQSQSADFLSLDPSEIIFIVNTDYRRFYEGIEHFVDQTQDTFEALFDLTCFPDVLTEGRRLREFAEVSGEQTRVPSADYLMGHVAAPSK